MKLSALRRAARGRRLAWLAVLALLFQQFGMVAYACTSTPTGPGPAPVVATMAGMAGMAGMADCDGMRMPPPPPPLCDQHCDPDTPTSADMRAGQVPPLALPPPLYALQDAPVGLAPMRARGRADVLLRRSDPPPTLLFCSLLI